MRPGAGFARRERAAGRAPGLVAATIYTARDAEAPTFAALFRDDVVPRLAAAGAAPLAGFADAAARDRSAAALGAGPAWTAAVGPELERRLAAAPERRRLAPTARSRLTGS